MLDAESFLELAKRNKHIKKLLKTNPELAAEEISNFKVRTPNNSNFFGTVPPSKLETHTYSPYENKADFDALRYMMYKSGTYDSSKSWEQNEKTGKLKGEFGKQHLEEMELHPMFKENMLYKRIKENFEDEDIIWILNNIAQNNQDNKELLYAEYGGDLATAIAPQLIGTAANAALPGLGAVVTPVLSAVLQSIVGKKNELKTITDHLTSLSPSTNPYGNYKNGGEIYIKEENKGKFTKSANAAGKSVQEHAHDVVNNPNSTELQRKRAQFAINAKKWKHELGGEINTGYEDLIELSGMKHSQGGIDVNNKGIPTENGIAEVESGETILRIGGKSFVFSKALKVN